jgi:hypothetical protein
MNLKILKQKLLKKKTIRRWSLINIVIHLIYLVPVKVKGLAGSVSLGKLDW